VDFWFDANRSYVVAPGSRGWHGGILSGTAGGER
jgi:hypothetical protein